MIATLELYPSHEFWENDLEMPTSKLLSDFQNVDVRTNWLHSLSGKQLNVVFQHYISQHSDNLSIQCKRKILINCSKGLFNYYLVNHFNNARLESAIREVAKLALTEATMNFFLVRNSRYDKKSLLFILFNIDPNLLKCVYHFDKVQKKGFASFALKDSSRQMNILFKDFLSKEVVQQILQEHDLEQNDEFDSQLQGIFPYRNRIYLFVRRASYADLLIKSNRIIHGYKPDWIILDFSPHGNQVNLCARNLNQSIKIANNIAGKYFQRECSFISMQNQNFAAQVRTFFEVCMKNADDNICLFELKFRSKKFKSNTYLVLNINPKDSIAEELQILKLSVGDILEDVTLITSARIIFQGKRVTLFFSSNMQCGITIHYSEHVLEKKERENFTLQMKEFYGITILPKTRCCSYC